MFTLAGGFEYTIQIKVISSPTPACIQLRSADTSGGSRYRNMLYPPQPQHVSNYALQIPQKDLDTEICYILPNPSMYPTTLCRYLRRI